MPLSIQLPNVRKLFLCDPGYVMFEADLKGADAQVVAWEAEDDDLKAAFRAGIDVHSKNAEDMIGSSFTRLTGHHRDAKRQELKKAVHATNYGGSARTLAITLGWLTRDADKFQHRWFSLHPGILKWHERIKRQLASNRTIHNSLGFRRVFFDRPDSCFAEALAWIPQSTVALNTYHGALQLEQRFWPDHLDDSFYPTTPEGIILQTHDSLNFQFWHEFVPAAKEIAQTLLVKTPYPDPLFIPWDLKSSIRSWGEMGKCE